MSRNNLRIVLLLESVLAMLISSFHDDRYEFPFYRGYSLAEKLYEENARNDNGNLLLIIT